MFTYLQAKAQWDSRRKHALHKTIMRDTRMTLDGEVFKFEYLNYTYTYDQKTSKYTRVPQPFLLATLTPDNLLTFCAPIDKMHMSAQKRLSSLLGARIYSDATHYRNYKSRLRVWASWLNLPTKERTMPYHQGQQWQQQGLGVPKCLNPVADEKIVVAKEAIADTKDRTATIRKLTTSMALIGAFDGLIHSHMEHSFFKHKVKSASTIDIDDPLADDAEAVFALGLSRMNRLSTHTWSGGVYSKLDTDQIIAEYRRRAVTRGMAVLRKSIYEEQDAFVFKAV